MSETTCPSEHTINWWTDKCYDCGHLLAMHRDANAEAPVEPVEGSEEGAVFVPLGDCALCTMQKGLEESIEAQNTALRSYARDMRQEAKDFAEGLQNAAKQYIDAENERFADVAKNYVDGQITSSQATAKTYVDTEIGKVPTWVNNRFVQVVKAEALKVDPRI